MEAAREDTPIHSLIDQFHQPIYKYCYHMLRHRQEAEDAVQDVFLKAIKYTNEMDTIQSSRAWLYRIAHNHCLNMMKRKRLLSFIPFQPESSHSSLQDSSYTQLESSMEIENLLSILRPLDRSILLLRIIEDKTYEEIGAIISATPESVRKRFERAKQKIKKNCTPEGEIAHEANSISYI